MNSIKILLTLALIFFFTMLIVMTGCSVQKETKTEKTHYFFVYE
jgi:hypothetical protein